MNTQVEMYYKIDCGLVIYDIHKPYPGQGLTYEECMKDVCGLPGPMPVKKPYTPFLDMYNALLNNK